MTEPACGAPPMTSRSWLALMKDMTHAACFKSYEREATVVSSVKVEIYTKIYCGYCTRAKQLLVHKGVEITEYDITLGGEKRREMIERSPDARTVPQIFIGDIAIGGADDLAALEREGKLDALLGL